MAAFELENKNVEQIANHHDNGDPYPECENQNNA